MTGATTAEERYDWVTVRVRHEREQSKCQQSTIKMRNESLLTTIQYPNFHMSCLHGSIILYFQ
jgi:hypothetical protein